MVVKKDTTELLKRIRDVMQRKLVDAYLIPMGDAHNNEYLSDCDGKISFISGFTGSAGVVVITMLKAALWTDGRYFEQAENQMDHHWTLMRQGQRQTPRQGEWLNTEIGSTGKVGIYKYQVTVDMYSQIRHDLRDGRTVELCDECFVSQVWTDRPARLSNTIIILPETFTGQSWRSKICALRKTLKEEAVHGLFISALDEIAWLFNLRGSDIAHNPVFFSFCFVTQLDIHLFLDVAKMERSPGLADYLSDEYDYKTHVHEYDAIGTFLARFAQDCVTVWLDPRTVCGFVFALKESQRHVVRSPIAMMKAIKSDEEILGMQQCNIVDSVALCQYFVWLEHEVSTGSAVTESGAADKLDGLRALLPGFFSLSFETISCSGRNGGMIHYRAVAGEDAAITDTEMYLCDSGGQYMTGTTDVTRTLHFGRPRPEERRANTLVLQGHIALASLVFPEGVLGSKLDTVARTHLWRHGMDYGHGTGHGVGAFLNVHEGPMGLSGSRVVTDEPGLRQRMVLTIEPGFYKSHEYGIRIENDFVLVAANVGGPPSDHSGRFLRFEPLTYFPIQTKLMDLDLMCDADVAWVNDYHAACRDKIGPELLLRGLHNEARWLTRETEPIAKN